MRPALDYFLKGNAKAYGPVQPKYGAGTASWKPLLAPSCARLAPFLPSTAQRPKRPSSADNVAFGSGDLHLENRVQSRGGPFHRASEGMETATASRQLPEAVPPVTGFSGLGENAALPAPGPYEAPNPFPSYSQFTERLYRQNMFTMKLGLSNIEEALRLEGNPHHKHKRVFVAGTNGKGTISSALSNILCSGSEGSSSTTMSSAKKWKVGFFSSPHVIDFRERFRIDGVPVGEELCHKIGVEVLTKFGGTGGNFAASLSPMKKLIGSSESNASTASPSIDGGSTYACAVSFGLN